MDIHTLKTDSKVFNDVLYGNKNFEIRLNDRDFKEGDVLNLKETRHTGEQMKQGSPLKYTGTEINVKVSYILQGAIYGLIDGWVIMSFVGMED